MHIRIERVIPNIRIDERSCDTRKLMKISKYGFDTEIDTRCSCSQNHIYPYLAGAVMHFDRLQTQSRHLNRVQIFQVTLPQLDEPNRLRQEQQIHRITTLLRLLLNPQRHTFQVFHRGLPISRVGQLSSVEVVAFFNYRRWIYDSIFSSIII